VKKASKILPTIVKKVGLIFLTDDMTLNGLFLGYPSGKL